MFLSFRHSVPLVFAALCCTCCTTPEQQADEDYAELCATAQQVSVELAGITDADSAQRALPALEEHAETLRDTLARLDELALEPEMTPEVCRRVGERHHEALKAVVEANVKQLERLARRSLYHSDPLKRLLGRELAYYSNKKTHPWARAVLAGREYRPRKNSGKR